MNDTSNNCLICGEERSASAAKCKLCGMETGKIFRKDEFTFCSPFCASKFDKIYRLSSAPERADMAKREIII